MKFKPHITTSTFIFIAFVILASIFTFYGPELNPGFEITDVFPTTALLFGILSGFTVSILWGRLEKTRGCLTDETGIIYSIYYRSAVFGKTIQNKVSDLIDDYLIATTDAPLEEFNKSQDEFVKLYNYILNLKPSKEHTFERGDMLAMLDEDIKNRTHVLFHSMAKLVPYLSYSVYVLGFMLILLIFYMHNYTFASAVITILLSSTVVLVMLLIDDLNKMKLWANIFMEVNLNSIYDVIGKKRYYEEWLMKQGYQSPKPGETYRIRDKSGKIIEKTAPKK
jgi:ABC-type multidrug transport system fused ATPase/permease subunit